MEGKHIRFTQLLESHLNNTIKKEFEDELLTADLLPRIRGRIMELISSVFQKSTHNLDAKAVNWLANQYFKSIRVSTQSESTEMTELVIINEHRLEDMPFHDIELLRNLYSTSTAPWARDLEEEYARRNQS